MPKVLCLGIMVADVVAKPVEKLPTPGTLALAGELRLHAGGCAANTGSALARLGVAASLAGALGEDGFGDFILGEMQRRGVGTGGLVRKGRVATSASLVLVNRAGERAFVHHPGANAEFKPEDLPWKFVKRHRHLHVAGSFLLKHWDGRPLAGLLERARMAGISTSLDTVYNPRLNLLRLIKPCLPHLDYFLPSLEEARLMSGSSRPEGMAQTFADLGAGVVGIKMGAKGSYFLGLEGGLRTPAPRVRPVDTTGAGDAFCAGFLAARLWGWELKKAAALGSVVGTASCSRVGAYDGVPDRTEAMRLLRRWYRFK